MNVVLGAELQPEKRLEAAEAPWKGMSDEQSSDEEVEVGSSLYPGGLAPKRMRMRPEDRKVEASSNRREGAGGREELEGRG